MALRNEVLDYFSLHGWNEVYNYSFSNEKQDRELGFVDSENAVAIRNAFNEEYTLMRRSLAGRLFENIRDNMRHASVIKFFEVGNIYHKDSDRNIAHTALIE